MTDKHASPWTIDGVAVVLLSAALLFCMTLPPAQAAEFDAYDLTEKDPSYVLHLASQSSVGGIVIVSYAADSETINIYYNIAADFADEGAPVKAFFIAKADETNAAAVYFNGLEYDKTAELDRLRASIANGIEKNLYGDHKE